MTTKLPKHPRPEDFESHHRTIFGREIVLHRREAYERARAEFWEAVARKAVETLTSIGDESAQDGVCDTWHAGAARDTIDAIGPLPPTPASQ